MGTARQVQGAWSRVLAVDTDAKMYLRRYLQRRRTMAVHPSTALLKLKEPYSFELGKGGEEVR